MPETFASRRDLLTTVRTLGLGAIALFVPRRSVTAAQSDIERLYVEWRRLAENADSHALTDAESDRLADRLADLERQIANTPSNSTEDVYRKIAMSHRNGGISDADFGPRALADEAYAALKGDVLDL